MWKAATFATFVLCGLFFYVLLSAVAAGTTGLTAIAAIPILIALVLGGFTPLILSLNFRAGVRTGQVLSASLIGYVLILVAADPSDAFALVATVPLVATIFISQFAHVRRKPSSADKMRHGYISMGVLTGIAAAWLIVEILIRLLT
jgi:hypothetical protein